jgi:hypothetical protein
MPLLRYFLYVGGALLALLFVCDAVLPTVPLPGSLTAGSELPVVRIHSDRKLPERVVFDTTKPMVAPVAVAKAGTTVPASASVADPSAKGGVREAFAQLMPSQPKVEAAPAEPKKAEAKRQPKRRVAKARSNPRPLLVAQQPHFGLFATMW